MKKNMGKVDRAIRVLVAGLILGSYLVGFISGWVAIILCIIGIIFVLTSLIGFCPAYPIFGISTKKK